MDKVRIVNARNKLIEYRRAYEESVKERDALIRELSNKYTVMELSRLFGMKHQNVSKIVNN